MIKHKKRLLSFSSFLSLTFLLSSSKTFPEKYELSWASDEPSRLIIKKAPTSEGNLEKDKMAMGYSPLLNLVNTLNAESQISERLTKEFGEQFDLLVLEDSCRFYLICSLFPNKNTLNGRAEITEFQAPPKGRVFYKRNPTISSWSPSLLKHFIQCHLFEKFSAILDKESVL